MQWSFTPDSRTSTIETPFFEDARADFAPYYSTNVSASLKDAQELVIKELRKLDAKTTAFQSGKFIIGGRERCGYVIEFLMNNQSGRIAVAGLPMKSPKPDKETRVRIQCLLNVRDWLKAAVTMQVFSPDTSPLIPYLLVDGQHTVADYILSKGQLPLLAAPVITVEKE